MRVIDACPRHKMYKDTGGVWQKAKGEIIDVAEQVGFLSDTCPKCLKEKRRKDIAVKGLAFRILK